MLHETIHLYQHSLQGTGHEVIFCLSQISQIYLITGPLLIPYLYLPSCFSKQHCIEHILEIVILIINLIMTKIIAMLLLNLR